MIFLQGVEFHIAMNIALITFEGVGSSHFNSSCSTQFRRWSPRLYQIIQYLVLEICDYD